MDNRPIGIFDSGIGGLTVLKEFIKIMPNENFIYYADTKHLPYGGKAKDEIISYSKDIVDFFISKNVKAIIIACGTASSLAYDYLKENYKLPIFEIISPSIIDYQTKNIGVIATKGSIDSHIWENKLRKLNPQSSIYTVACPKLVPLAEKGLYNSFIAKYYLKKYLKELNNYNIDTLILGCTHYPLFSRIIKNIFGNKVELINLGNNSSQLFNNYLKDNSLETSNTQKGNVTYIVSGNEKIFLKKAVLFK